VDLVALVVRACPVVLALRVATLREQDRGKVPGRAAFWALALRADILKLDTEKHALSGSLRHPS
jgi:hypothetical protein